MHPAEANAPSSCDSAEDLATHTPLSSPGVAGGEGQLEELEPTLNLDDGPSLILGPVPLERRVPITRGDVQREVEVKLRMRIEIERAHELFAAAFASEEW